MPESQIDLSRLALDRTSQEVSDGLPGRPRRKWISRYLVPSGILLGFATLMMAMQLVRNQLQQEQIFCLSHHLHL